MNIKMVKSIMKNLIDNAESALIGSSIISLSDGQSIVSHTLSGNPTDKIDAIVANFTAYLSSTIEQTDLKSMGNYFALTLESGLFALAMPYKGFCWTMIFNLKEFSLGMIMNVIVPECISGFHSAVDN